MRDGPKVIANETLFTTDSVLFDALYVVGGTADNQAKFNQDVVYFINEAFKHYKPIGVATTGLPFFDASNAKRDLASYLQLIILTLGRNLSKPLHNNDFGIEIFIKSA